MIKRITSLALTLMLLCAATTNAQSTQTPSAPNQQSATSIEETKRRVQQLSEGEKRRVVVRLRYGSKVKGYIDTKEDERFTIIDKSGARTVIAYTDVVEIKPEKRISTGKAILIGAGITVGALMLLGGILNSIN